MSPFALTMISLFGLYLAFTITFQIVWRVKGKKRLSEIVAVGSELTIKKDILPRIYVFGERLILASMLIPVLLNYIKANPEYKWPASAFGILFLSILNCWGVVQFKRGGDVFIKVDEGKKLTINDVPIHPGVEIKLRTKKSVTSQGGAYYDLIMNGDKKRILKVLDGVDEYEVRYAKSTILTFLTTNASLNPASDNS